jgi:hypothetical protein
VTKKYKAKKPVIGYPPGTSKSPLYLESPNLENRHIAWRFGAADLGGKFSCHDFDHNDFKLLWDKLRAFEKMNVAELRNTGSFHPIPTANMAKSAKDRLQQIRLDDVDMLYSFHIEGACRLWCMRHENIFSVLWWDRRHEAYPVEKRHT